MRRQKRFAGVATLKSFRVFKRNIKPYLVCINPNQREYIGTELYRLAKGKIDLEFWQSLAPEGISLNRKIGNQFRRMGIHLAHARKDVEKAINSLGTDARDTLDDDVDWDGILLKIDFGLQSAVTMRKLNAAIIHPDLRTGTEKTLIRPGDEVEPQGYPARGVHISDYWFIERAEQLLKECRDPKGRKLHLADSHRIIAQSFCAAFGECAWTAGRIKSALHHIKVRPRPKYTPHCQGTPLTDRKAFAIPDTKKLSS
jgi:hypothetical protein